MSSRSILIVDDDDGVADMLTRFFERRGWSVARASDGVAGLQAYDRDMANVVLLDVRMPGVSGMDVLDALLRRDPDATVIMLTGHGDVDMAVEAMRLGAETFLSKPVSLEHLAVAADKAYEKNMLVRRSRYQDQEGFDQASLSSLGHSEQMQGVARQLARLAAGSAPILLTGETGTGKGWAAKLIHAASPRAQRPFVSINCAGLTATFLDTELFGHEKGAFTDAKNAKPGLFEVADGGTIFLDEIGDLAPELQPKLLTVLETSRFRRLGATREIEVDVRLVAATHKDLAAEVKAGRFREDLYYRLAVLPVELPALRDRDPSEIGWLAANILADLRRKAGSGPRRFSTSAIGALAAYRWPGNIRELRNIIERSMLLAGEAEELRPMHLPPELRPSQRQLSRDSEGGGDALLENVVKRHILEVLDRQKGNRLRAAKALGITRSTLYKRLAEYEGSGSS